MKNINQDIKLTGSTHMSADQFSGLAINNLVDFSILTTDNDLVINCWYDGAAKLFGYKAQEVLGQHIDIIFTDEDIKDGISTLEKEMTLKEGRATDNRWHVLKNGQRFYAYGMMFPLKDANGKLLGFIKILRDLTHRKRNEDKIHKHMQDLEKLIVHKDNILHILSHDLRSPLSSIIQIADYLKSDFNQMSPENVEQMLGTLYQASKDELNMLDYLLEWARIKHAGDIYTPAILDLRKIVMQVIETFNEAAAGKSIILHSEVMIDTIVYADRKMLTSILQNLVSNAVKFTPSGGSITVSASSKSGQVRVKVKDTGIGMSAEKVDRLFMAQLKTLAQSREEHKGGGIGLLLVKGFVERNGGEICAESEEGKGSTFYFTLPVGKHSEEKMSSDNIQFSIEV